MSDCTSGVFPIFVDGRKVIIELVHFGRSIGTSEALEEFGKRKFRAALADELRAFNVEYRLISHEFPVVALDKSEWWHDLTALSNSHDVAYLNRGHFVQGGAFGLDECMWESEDRFAVVRKTA